MMYVFQILNSMAWGMALGPVFDRYLYYLGGGAAVGPTLVPKHQRNSLVGMTESISGLSSLFLAIPVGLLVDREQQSRSRLLKQSTVFAVLSCILAIVACITDVVLFLFASLVLLGVFMEISGSTSEAIFADSVPAGSRSGVFTTKTILTTVGTAIGPMLSAIGLLIIGDNWQPHQMKAVVIVGSLFMPISCIPCLFFQDPPVAASVPSATQSPAIESPGAVSFSCPQNPLRARKFGPLRGRHVPFILATADFITCIGAGMTVKFFNLFFIQDMHFNPTDICLLQTAYPLVIAVFVKFTQRLAKPFGRAQASCAFFSVNVLCLLMLSQVKSLPMLLCVFLLRGGFANSTSAIDRSILMDCTPSSQRGRWNAVQSFTSMTWSGSAFLGGLSADSHDYRFTFLITAFVYATACVVYSPLLALVPRREADAACGAAQDVRELPLVEAAVGA